MIFLKENFYSDLRHSIEVDDVLGHYDIETVDIHEPLDSFNVFAKGMPTIFDKGIMYKKFYIEAENAGDLELKKSAVDLLLKHVEDAQKLSNLQT